MTRTGKSNTTKIIAKSVFELRTVKNKEANHLRIGQIIFDPNGEYANENVQDNNSALKNVWKLSQGSKKENEVVTYGIHAHKNDPDRKMMLLNFYLDDNLQIGKDIIDSSFKKDDAKFIENFKQVLFDKPEESDKSATIRYNQDRLRPPRRGLIFSGSFPDFASASPCPATGCDDGVRHACRSGRVRTRRGTPPRRARSTRRTRRATGGSGS